MKNWKREEKRKGSKERRKEETRETVSKQPSSTAEIRRLRLTPGPSSLREGGTEVDNQVAAPTESSTPNLHRATIAQQRVRMEGWRQRRLGSKGSNLEKEEIKKSLDAHRPSHGRSWLPKPPGRVAYLGNRTVWPVRARCSQKRHGFLEPELDPDIGLPLLGVIADARHEAAQERIAEGCV